MTEYDKSMTEYDKSITKHVPFVQVPAIYEKLIKESSGRWSSIAKRHAKLLLEPSPEELKAKAKRCEKIGVQS